MSLDLFFTIPEGGGTGSVGGNVPVQGFGCVAGPNHPELWWYFRARGEMWTLDVGPASRQEGDFYIPHEAAVWSAHGAWGKDYAAGWMDHDTADLIIKEALTRYLVGGPSWEAPADLYLFSDPGFVGRP